MNKIYLYFTSIAFIFIMAACDNSKPTELKIQENDECQLNCPTAIVKATDSAIIVIDRSRAYEINTLSGMMSTIDIETEMNDFANFLAKISGQQLTDSTPIPPLALLGFGANSNYKLFASALPTIDSTGMQILPTTIFHNGKDFKFLFDDKANIATNVPQGNFYYYLSDSIIMTNYAMQCAQSEKPNDIPSIMLFVKQKSDEFVLQKTIELPRCEKENAAAETNVMNSVYTYVSQPKFATGKGKIFASIAGSVFEIDKDGTAVKITESSKTIYTFKVENETITTIEGSDGNFNKIVEYDFDGKVKHERDIVISGKSKCCQYIDGKLYIITLKEQNFYLTIM